LCQIPPPDDYALPTEANRPDNPPKKRELTESEILSIQLFQRHFNTIGSDKAYELERKGMDHAAKRLLQNIHREHPESKVQSPEILSKRGVETLIRNLAACDVRKIGCCENVCQAFTGENSDAKVCTELTNKRVPDGSSKKLKTVKVVCNAQRKKTTNEFQSGHKLEDKNTYYYISPRARMEACWGNPELAKKWNRGSYGKKLTELVKSAHRLSSEVSAEDRRYRDYYDGDVSQHLMSKGGIGFMNDHRETAFVVSSDGAVLNLMKGGSGNFWVGIIQFLDFEPEERLKSKNIATVFLIPGKPVNMDSFLFPFIQDVVSFGYGFWVWDCLEEEYFHWKAWWLHMAGDMPALAQIAKLTGHNGKVGCRCCKVVGILVGKTYYFPLKLIKSLEEIRWSEQNPGVPFPGNLKERRCRDDDSVVQRPEEGYSQEELEEMCQSFDQWGQGVQYYLKMLEICKTKGKAASRDTGITGVPAISALPTFMGPATFCLQDIAHLILLNLITLLFSILLGLDKHLEDDPNSKLYTLSSEARTQLGIWVEESYQFIPYSFSQSRARNTDKYLHTKYKMHEWWWVLDWCLVPMLRLLDYPLEYLKVAALLVSIVRDAFAHEYSEESRLKFKAKCSEFHNSWEDQFVHQDIRLADRMPMCVHHVIHLPKSIQNSAPLILSSQLVTERHIGDIERQIKSDRLPIANLFQQTILREQLAIVEIKYPELFDYLTEAKTFRLVVVTQPGSNVSGRSPRYNKWPLKEIRRLPKESSISRLWNQEVEATRRFYEANEVCIPNGRKFEDSMALFTRFGKAGLKNGEILRSYRQEAGFKGRCRSSRHFQVSLSFQLMVDI
jgi:hypothetical protein